MIDDYTDLLEDNETLLWQGRPDPSLRLDQTTAIRIGFAVIGLAAVAYLFAGFGRETIAFRAFYWIIILLTVMVAGKAIAAPLIVRRYSTYALTNKRALIAEALPWRTRTLRSYPILPSTEIKLQGKPPNSIIFATETEIDDDGYKITIERGFDRISDSDVVMTLIREIQENTI